MAPVLPFPLCRRRRFIERHVSIMAALPPSKANRHLDLQLKIQRQVMNTRGIDDDLATAELKKLEAAMLAALSQRSRGGAA